MSTGGSEGDVTTQARQPVRSNGYAAIRDYALIGDGRTGALVALDGAIDWLCLPNVDSPSTFARLLDAERGGSFQLAPEEPFEADRRYVDGTNVLETTFRTASGSVRVTDAMALTDRARISPMREVIRKVEGLDGRVRMGWSLEPRFYYGRHEAKLGRREDRVFFSHGRDALALNLWDAGVPEQRGDAAVAGTFSAEAGRASILSLAAAYKEPAVLPGREDTESRLVRTVRFWQGWSGRAEYEGPWRDQVVRSALVLKLLVYAPSGAIVAAPTTSLPEWYGGGRNWDYRYAWVRDASWTLDALLRLGYRDEAHAFFWWIMHASRLTQPRLQILYRVDGGTKAHEYELDEFEGHGGSKPVRVGNGAADQIQLDVYGGLFEAACLYVREGGEIDRDTGKELAEIADYVVENWREKDAGIWEVRSDPAHFIQSKALCWVALDRACALAAAGACPRGEDEWRTEADAVREFVHEQGWDEERRSYVRAPDQRELDGSLLTMALLEFDDPRGERMQGLMAAVRRELADGPLVYRYRGDDGVAGEEGAFVTCSFWLVDALARGGRLDEAEQLMDELVSLGNDVGLFSEEMDPRTHDFLGNFPQGLTHLALVNAAVSIEDAKAGRE
jgi:GH15 family glucan-1,4-alpha-glucosidase